VGRHFANVAIAALVAVGGLVAIAPATGGATGPCSASPTRTITGVQSARFTTTLGPNERVDANSASWAPSTAMPYPVYFDANADSCWDGGRITGTFPIETTWNVYHDSAGIGVGGPNVVVDHPRIFNVGDGIRIRANAANFRVEDAYLSYIRDDCIENDRLFSGTITHSFLDGCYVAFSTRQAGTSSVDGHLNTETISDSLVRLQAMPTVYSGSAAGHGGFFKWDVPGGTSPKLVITNTIFRADQNTNHQDLNLPAGYSATCSNNTMVWLGPGAFPGSPSSCWTVTTDRAVWDAAVRAWDIAHPGVITGPEVSVGDASVDEGDSGARTVQFPLTLSEPPASGKSVTVYWSTAPGTAGSNDFTTKKGKTVFTGSQVSKTITVTVKQDTSDEPNELMYLLVAGVDGGANHRERGTGTIVDDDPGSGIRLLVSDATVVEGDSGTRNLVVPITLTQSAATDAAVSAHWSTVATGSAAPGTDYTGKSGTLSIAAGKRQGTVTIPILSDTGSEGTETFQLVVSTATNATILDGTGVITIRDDD
jgi:hypothetical protein